MPHGGRRPSSNGRKTSISDVESPDSPDVGDNGADSPKMVNSGADSPDIDEIRPDLDEIGENIAKLPSESAARADSFENHPIPNKPGMGSPWKFDATRPRDHPFYCPEHLRCYPPPEVDMGLYPDYVEGMWCSTCGRPVRADGRTARRGKGVRQPCPECGFRRPGEAHGKSIAERTPEEKAAYLEQRRRSMAAVGRSRKGTSKKITVVDALREKVEERADQVMRPFFDGLALEPTPGWSPSTKLEFYAQQAALSEKLLNRTHGTPTSSHRRVDASGEDVFGAGEVSGAALAEVLAALVAGGAPPSVDAEDADWWEDGEIEQEVAT
jgi:hypothetical protein